MIIWQVRVGTFLENKVFKKSIFSKTYFFIKNWSASPIFFKEFFSERFNQFLTLKNDFENQNFEMFEEVVHNLGKSGDDII